VNSSFLAYVGEGVRGGLDILMGTKEYMRKKIRKKRESKKKR